MGDISMHKNLDIMYFLHMKCSIGKMSKFISSFGVTVHTTVTLRKNLVAFCIKVINLTSNQEKHFLGKFCLYGKNYEK